MLRYEGITMSLNELRKYLEVAVIYDGHPTLVVTKSFFDNLTRGMDPVVLDKCTIIVVDD